MPFDHAIAETLDARLDALRENVSSEDFAAIKAIVRAADHATLSALAKEHAAKVEARRDVNHKYIDPVYWAYHKYDIAKRLGLLSSPPLRILDIGAGACHFAAVCRHYGHDVVSTDIEVPIYDEIAAAWGETRTIHRVEPQTPLPNRGKFDMITAIAINFHGKRVPEGQKPYWTMDDWKFFLRDLTSNQLRYPGRIWFRLNVEIWDGQKVFNSEVMDLLEAHGAVVDRRKGTIDWKLITKPEL